MCLGVCSVYAGDLPFCSNRTIHEVTHRAGCTVGDSKCWLTKGGFCTDYVLKKSRVDPSGSAVSWLNVPPDEVKAGDIAVFAYRSHYAFIESVVRNKQGKPVAVNVSEFNFGDCLVDEQTMVTEKYGRVNTRPGIPLKVVDGGFLRSSPPVSR
jgi:hypothetical protein